MWERDLQGEEVIIDNFVLGFPSYIQGHRVSSLGCISSEPEQPRGQRAGLDPRWTPATS